MEVNGRIFQASRINTGPEMYMIASVQKVGVCEYTDAFPFSDSVLVVVV